jgi:CubicO group peptidase (beta-lactamase class C family)
MSIEGNELDKSASVAVASITKTFVAAEVLLLAKSGRINLDAPLSTYVKHRLTSNGATVRQHLAMRSGLPNYLPADYSRMDKAIAAAPARHWTGEQILAYDTAPSGKPDSEYNYSNPNYVLLGMLIEKGPASRWRPCCAVIWRSRPDWSEPRSRMPSGRGH